MASRIDSKQAACDYREWATEAIRNFLRWKMEGKAHNVTSRPVVLKQAQTLDDVIAESHPLADDLDYRDYLRVRIALEEFKHDNPQYGQLEELLVHHGYYGRPVATFQARLPFVSLPRRLGLLGANVIAGAEASLMRFETFLARRLEENATGSAEGKAS